MTAEIKGGPLSGAVAAVPSKSDMHRVLICSAFAEGKTRIAARGEPSDDVAATLRCLSALGVGIERNDDGVNVTPAKSVPENAKLYVGESGSTFRFLVPVAASLGVTFDFITEGRLGSRPMEPLIEALEAHGAKFERPGNGVLRVSGKLSGNEYAIRSDVSSQFISGILFALAVTGGGSVHLIGKTESAGYIEMTLDALSRFGIRTEFKTARSPSRANSEARDRSPRKATGPARRSGSAPEPRAAGSPSRGCRGSRVRETARSSIYCAEWAHPLRPKETRSPYRAAIFTESNSTRRTSPISPRRSPRARRYRKGRQ